MPRAWGGFALAAALLASAPDAAAQVFVAESSRPNFTIGPLFVVATAPADANDPVNVSVSWNVVGRDGAAPGHQDLLLLWPAEIATATTQGAADAELLRYVDTHGYSAVGSGRLTLRARATNTLGLGTPAETLPVSASFVSIARRDAPVQAGTAALVRIPWTPDFGDPRRVLTLTLPVRGMIGAKPATWLEEVFWGRRNVLAVGWGDIGSIVFYPLHAEHRDRIVHLTRDHSRLLATFADAEHLRIEGIEPPHAVRRGSRVRVGADTVTMPLNTAGDGTPQVLKVQYAYYRGVFAWRPVLISVGLLILGNLTGLWMISGEVRRVMRSRLRLGHGHGGREPTLTPERLSEIKPGQSRYDDVVRLCGLPDEQHRRASAGERRTLVYRATHRRPERGLSVGWLTAVRHWDIERYEVEIELDGERVEDVVFHVRRSRTNAPD